MKAGRRGASALVSHAAAHHDATLSWSDIEWIRGLTGLPLVLKGVLTRSDAQRAADAGVDGLIVSTHGGRQLDRVVPALHALPDVVDGAAEHCEVYLDGGVRTGSDVLMALALGARAVFLGRPVLLALAEGGASGVAALIGDVVAELSEAMLPSGLSRLTEIDRSLLRDAPHPEFRS